jgi:hypothetical protein
MNGPGSKRSVARRSHSSTRTDRTCIKLRALAGAKRPRPTVRSASSRRNPHPHQKRPIKLAGEAGGIARVLGSQRGPDRPELVGSASGRVGRVGVTVRSGVVGA